MKPARRRPQSGKAQIKINMKNIITAMPSARATPGSLHSVFAMQRTKPCVSLSHFFILLNYNLSDAFQVCFILFGRPFGSGFYGFRCATEHPADGSPSGPANPYRFNNYKFKIGIFKKIIKALASFRDEAFI